MAFVSAKTLIIHRIVWLITVGYFLLRSPETVYSNAIVAMLGQSLNLSPTYVGANDQLVVLVAALLFASALQDFAALFRNNYIDYFRTTLPMRLVLFFGFSAASYMHLPGYESASLFSYMFVEVVLNFWLYITIREEHNEQLRLTIRDNRGQENQEFE